MSRIDAFFDSLYRYGMNLLFVWKLTDCQHKKAYPLIGMEGMYGYYCPECEGTWSAW